MASLTILASGPLGAQSTAGEAVEPSENQLEEILVTAQRRTERLQDVPISAQVVGAQELRDRNINSLVTLTDSVPSVHIVPSGRSSTVVMRGVGSGENQAFDQSVGTFIDDIYHGRSRTSSASFLDLDRVEILKGPQSTFFGNNAIAGAFNIVTRKPGDSFEAWARALASPTSGTHAGQYAAEGAVGGPINDRFGMRVAATYNGQRGWLENVATGEHVPKERNVAGRATFVFHPGENFDATLKVEAGRNKNETGLPIQADQCPPAAPFTPSGFCGLALSLGTPTDPEANLIGSSPEQRVDLDTTEYVLTANYTKAEHTLASVTGYYEYDFNLDVDSDFTHLQLVNVHAPESYHQFSQELRLASPTDRKIEYLAGLYYQEDSLFFRQDTGFFFLTPVIAGLPAPFTSLVPQLPLGQDINFGQDERSYAAFGSVTWNVTDKLKLSSGLRGSRVDKEYDWNLFYGTATRNFGGLIALPDALQPLPAFLGLGVPAALSGSRQDHAWLPSARIQYQVGAPAMLYLSYARGFKAGGFNGSDNSGNAANLPFDPEYVDAYEAGLKSEWLDDTLLLNLAVFLSDYDDLQVTVNSSNAAGAFTSFVRNAAQSRSKGVEVEAQWALTRGLRLSAYVAYNESYYVNYENVSLTQLQALAYNQCLAANPPPSTACVPLGTQDLSGRPTAFAPRWSGSVSGAYRVDLPRNYRFTTELTGAFSSSYFTNDGNDDPLTQQDRYVRLDARFSLESPDGRWGLDVIGKNLNDRNISTWGFHWPNSLGSTGVQRQQPRNVALQFRYQW